MVLKPVSDVYGAILEVAFSFKGKAAKFHELPYRKIQQSIGERVDYIGFITEGNTPAPELLTNEELEIHMSQIFVPDSPVRTLHLLKNKLDFQRLSKNMAKIRPEQGYVGTTEWIQDAFMVARMEDQWGVIIQSVYHPRMADSSIALQIAQDDKWPYLMKPTFWMLEGGNILVESDFALVGMDTIAENLYEFLQGGEGEGENIEAWIIEKIRQTLALSHIIPVGTRNYFENRPKIAGRYQPFYHLDLFLTLGGKTRENRSLLFVGDPEFTAFVIFQSHSIQLPTPDEGIMDRLTEVRKSLHDLQHLRTPFNAPPVFEVRSVPMLFYEGVWYSFNNVLVEITDTTKRIIALDYEEPANEADKELNEIMVTLKAECERIWDGFEVIWTGNPDFNKMWAKKMGGLRCVTKVMKRGNYSSESSAKSPSEESFRTPFR